MWRIDALPRVICTPEGYTGVHYATLITGVGTVMEVYTVDDSRGGKVRTISYVGGWPTPYFYSRSTPYMYVMMLDSSYEWSISHVED